MKFIAFTLGLLLTITVALRLGGGSELVPTLETDGAANAAVAPSNEIEFRQAVALALPAEEAEPPKPILPVDVDAAQAAWHNWRLQNNISESAMAIGLKGEILHSEGLQRSAQTAYPVASLSKAITAMCLNVVLTETGYRWSTTLGDLSPALAAMNMKPHAGVERLRLADLASHTSGFPKNIDRNATAGEGRNLYTQQHFAREALTNPDRQPEIGKYNYSNVNYAVLGQVIIALSGMPYGDACRERVMESAGAMTAVLAGRMWATAGFGGWSVSAEDYARFVMHWLGPDKPWVSVPEKYPYHTKSGAGLGVFFTRTPHAYFASHNGLWKSKDPTRQHGAIFVTTESGGTFAANWSGTVSDAAYRKLREAIAPHLR